MEEDTRALMPSASSAPTSPNNAGAANPPSSPKRYPPAAGPKIGPQGNEYYYSRAPTLSGSGSAMGSGSASGTLLYSKSSAPAAPAPPRQRRVSSLRANSNLSSPPAVQNKGSSNMSSSRMVGPRAESTRTSSAQSYFPPPPRMGSFSVRSSQGSYASGAGAAERHVSEMYRHGIVVGTQSREQEQQQMLKNSSQELMSRIETSAVSPTSGAPTILKDRRQFSAPSLQFDSWNASWVVDIFALHHNALRREIVDMYDMLASMMRRRKTLRPAVDVAFFYAWFKELSWFLIEYFELEEQVLFPWVESRCLLMTRLCRAFRLRRKDQIRAMLIAMLRVEPILSNATKRKPISRPRSRPRSRRPSAPPSPGMTSPRTGSLSQSKLNSPEAKEGRERSPGSFRKLMDATAAKQTEKERPRTVTPSEVPVILKDSCDQLVEKINVYFSDFSQSGAMYGLIAQAFTAKEKRELDRRVVDWIFKRRHTGRYIMMMSFWIYEVYGDRKFREFKWNHLGPLRSMRCGVWEKSHQRHLGFARKFRRWAADYQEERVKFQRKHDIRLIPARVNAGVLPRAPVNDATDLTWVADSAAANTPRYPAMDYALDWSDEDDDQLIHSNVPEMDCDYYGEIDDAEQQTDVVEFIEEFVEEEIVEGDSIAALLALMRSSSS
ncbi:hypothetical protein FVE85_5041 [Porphyridium purpureum]|uniref:Uncharacterized protein n=1 Tax=Porphyridium purpureum TaxID=35688 RepID=A0A5J4YG82_PORPP|nr:hypothetical protein FVE85_5041 [Porphyridium purpureum]|eukprot:POR6133..scf237_24